MKRPSREQIEELRHNYPAGATVELIDMDDCQAPPAGTLGKIFGVDAMGSVLVKWDNGSMLSLIPGVDSFRIINSKDKKSFEAKFMDLCREYNVSPKKAVNAIANKIQASESKNNNAQR